MAVASAVVYSKRVKLFNTVCERVCACVRRVCGKSNKGVFISGASTSRRRVEIKLFGGHTHASARTRTHERAHMRTSALPASKYQHACIHSSVFKSYIALKGTFRSQTEEAKH